jgi:hypothetical protein
MKAKNCLNELYKLLVVASLKQIVNSNIIILICFIKINKPNIKSQKEEVK